MTTTRLPYTEYYLTIMKARNSEWQRERKKNNISKLHYIKPHIEEWESAYISYRQYEVKLIGHTRLTYKHFMSRNNQQPKCRNAVCRDQILTIKLCIQDCPQLRNSRKKYNIQDDIRTLLRESCEVGKRMRFLKETQMFEVI